MSTYYSYYIGYKKDGVLYPYGPYDYRRNLKPIICSSRSFASDIYEDFYRIGEQMMSDTFKKEFDISDSPDWYDVRYLPVDELPTGSYIKSGYFLQEDVDHYNSLDFFGRNEAIRYCDIFYEKLSPVVYAERLKAEITIKSTVANKTKNQEDCDNEDEDDEDEHTILDYMFFQYPDYTCKEYDAFVLRNAVGFMHESYDKDVKPEDLVIIVDIG